MFSENLFQRENIENVQNLQCHIKTCRYHKQKANLKVPSAVSIGICVAFVGFKMNSLQSPSRAVAQSCSALCLLLFFSHFEEIMEQRSSNLGIMRRYALLNEVVIKDIKCLLLIDFKVL